MPRLLHRWTPAQEQWVATEYPEFGGDRIAKLLRISGHAVRMKAARLGVSRVEDWAVYLPTDTVDRFYFYRPWTSEMAYVAGYLHADANLTDGAVQLDCSMWDGELVSHVRNALKSHHQVTLCPPYTSPSGVNHGWMIRCAITNRLVVQGLIDKTGLSSGKSYKDLGLPVGLPDDHVSHYLRGYFDGDGWVNPKDRSLGFTGTPTLLHQIIDIGTYLGVKTAKIEDNGGSPYNKKVRWAKLTDWDAWYRYLYRDCEHLFLHRKRTLIEQRLRDKLFGFTDIPYNTLHEPNQVFFCS